MHTSTGIAKKYGLEQYLDKPAEMNDAIFRLLLLQETSQVEQARKRKANTSEIIVKRPVAGKFVASCCGDAMYRYAVEMALKASTQTIAVFHRSRFVSVLQSMGIPNDSITQFCNSIVIDDDTRCIDQE